MGLRGQVELLLLATLVLGALLGAAAAMLHHGAARGVVIVDAIGHRVVLTKPPERIVSTSPAITEIVAALGGLRKLVGVDSYSNYPPAVRRLIQEGRIKVIGGYWNPDVEKIVELHPDLVILDSGVPSHYKVARVLDEYHIPYIFVRGGRCSSIRDVYADILLVGEALWNYSGAEKLVKHIESLISAVEENVSGLPRQKVLIILGPPSWGLWVAGSGTFISDEIRAAGGINAAARYYRWVRISYEEALSLNPNFTLITAMGGREAAVKIIKAWEATPLNKTAAFKLGRVCAVTGAADDALVRPGPRIAIAVQLLGHLLHPHHVAAPKNYMKYVVCLANLTRTSAISAAGASASSR